MRRFHAHLVLPLLLLAACDEPSSSLRAGRFSASLTGAVNTTYEGGGDFHTGTPGPGMQQFQLISNGTQSFAGQKFALTRWDGGRLRTGHHDITLVDLSAYLRGSSQQPRGITFQYFRVVNGIEEQYVAESGSVEITASSSDELEGRFTITAFRYCQLELQGLREVGPCDISAAPTESTPRVTVTGAFAATPFEPGVGIADLGR